MRRNAVHGEVLERAPLPAALKAFHNKERGEGASHFSLVQLLVCHRQVTLRWSTRRQGGTW